MSKSQPYKNWKIIRRPGEEAKEVPSGNVQVSKHSIKGPWAPIDEVYQDGWMTGFSLYRRKKRKYKNRRAHCETAYDKARTKALSKNNWFAAIKRINEADRAPAHPTPKPFTIVVTITIEATT